MPLNHRFVADRNPFSKSTINNSIKESNVEETRESFLIQKNEFSTEITNEINIVLNKNLEYFRLLININYTKKKK